MLLKKFFPTVCCLFLLQLGMAQKNAYTTIPDKETVIVPGEVSVTKHNLVVGNINIAYTATAGYIQLKNDTGKPIAKIFFTYYKKDKTEPDSRPVTFTFNGGPGSSSVWLHMGGLGPKRVLLDDMGAAPAPPYKIIDNEYTWLDKTDLVFIDPVSTGLSRAAAGEKPSQFHGYNEDIQSVATFIRNFLDKYERWSSPKYLAGESYGTTRAAGLSSYLQDRYRIFLNGVFLISAVLNFGSNDYYVGNDLPRALYLPTYTATAWYHKKLAPELQANLQKALKESEQFALGEFATALLKGGWMTDAEKDKIAEKMSYYTGLSKTYCLQANLRVHESQFFKELRRTDGLTVGRLDGRFTGRDLDDVGETASFDPSFANIDGSFTATLNDYLQRDLKFKSEDGYNIFGSVYPWNYNNVQNQFLNVAENLRKAMAKNPDMKVYVGAGYYDFATPYFTAGYDIEHMFLRPELRKNIQFNYYEAGHMYYIHKPSLQQFKKDIDTFFKWSHSANQ
jgi:carboxypeptidase C (cathepsin A)